MFNPILNIAELFAIALEILGTTVTAFFLPFNLLILSPILQFLGISV